MNRYESDLMVFLRGGSAKMNNGRISKTGGTAGDVPQIPGERLSAHPPN
jgi:hypothetical protein